MDTYEVVSIGMNHFRLLMFFRVLLDKTITVGWFG